MWIEESNNTPGDPERRLLKEVLFRAVNDCLGGDKTDCIAAQHDKREARWWLFRERSHRPFGFVWICEALELEPSNIRAHAKELIEVRDKTPLTRRYSDWVYYLNAKIAEAKKAA